MFKNITLFVISLLVAPGLGLFAAIHGMDVLHESSGVASLNELVAACVAMGASAPEGCAILDRLDLLKRISWIALAVTFALPLFYLAVAWILGRDRDRLARYFPWLVRLVLGILPLVLVAHALLVWFGTWEMVEMGFIPSRAWKLMLVLGGLGLLLAVSALSILASIRRMLEPDPLHVTGILLEKQDMPDLFARVSRIAARLKSREPERIILGIEPTAYVANVAIKLRGVGDLPVAETLYLSTPALRMLSEAELDALIGHELGHFRGADVEFSTRFSPSLRSLAIAAEAVAADEDDDDSASLALLPALGLLSFMLYTISRIVNRIRRQREFVADQASLEVSNPQAIASLLVKFSALTLQWHGFRHGLVQLLHRGVSRQNLSVDYLVRTRQFLAAADAAKLRHFIIEAHTPHPLDTHPSLTERAAAVGVDPASVLDASLASLNKPGVVSPGLEAVEERISQIDADYYRHPTSPVSISTDPALPPELSFS